MPNPKISTLVDAFTAATLNTTLWNSITGTATLDTTADVVTLAHPTTSGATNSFGATNLYDATASSVYAQVTAAPNGNGSTKTALVLRVDANNSVAVRAEAGSLKFTLQTAGTTVTTALGIYDPHTHRWWRIRESAGTWYADTSADGCTWTQRTSSAYSWAASAVAMTFAFQTSAGATEVAGMTATISHIGTPFGGGINPNWPLIDDAWGPYWNASSGVLNDRYVELSDRSRGGSGISRGRQYELDQVRSGELNATFANVDGLLDPTNASSPFAGRILPYQPFRKRAQWPPTLNLCSQTAATGGDQGGYAIGSTLAADSIFSDTDASGSCAITLSASPWMGITVLQAGVTSGATASGRICHTTQPSVLPGATYTLQMRVRNVTAATSLQVKAGIGWYNATTGGTATGFTYSSSSTLTGSSTAAWTYITVTATAPANAAGLDAGVMIAATAGATCSIQVDGWQLEKGAAATPWVAPGVCYTLYNGWVERWPSDWREGVYGTIGPTCVDAFALLSQVKLSDPLTQEIDSHNPRFLYKLDDPQGSDGASDSTGNYDQAEIATSKYGAGSLAFGSQIASSDPDGGFIGSSGTVVTIDNPNPGTTIPSPATYLKLTQAGITGPADPTSWARTLAFRYTGPTPTAAAYMWTCMDGQRAGGVPTGSRIWLSLDNTGVPRFWLAGPTGAGTLYAPAGTPNCADGNWHWVLFGYNLATQQVLFSIDGAIAAYVGSVPTTYTPTGLISDNLGGWVDSGVGGGTYQNFKGELAFAGELQGWVSTGAQIAGLYSAWKSSFTGESSTARYQRILRYGGWTGKTSLQTGLTTSMGPALFGGQDALSALQAVVDTEGGAHYAAADGTLTFRSRSARYNAMTAALTFGERADLGEYPYEECKLDYDPTRLANQVTVTQASTGQVFAAQDAASITAYFPRTLTRTVNTSSVAECQDAAYYLLSRYKQPATRVTSLKLHPSAMPTLWPAVLGLELGTRIRVMRRPPNVPAIQADCFVESIKWDMDDRGEAFVTLQCSPVDTTPYALFASWHTTLQSSVTSGVTSIVVNASADTVNPLATQLGFGQQLVLGQNTANQETVTVSSVGTTTAGWTTATLTLTAATTKAHTAGDVICEPLPAGITDPTTWDATSQFDEIAFAY
ncbi:hypothetical protein AB0M92_19190 [Streptomyces sp. NPDC051582]|uniref:hypothetical protein n=1 Tax=Streptomyces sp. NPDC051582 TaxID=3155167 RepID=UPI00344277A2